MKYSFHLSFLLVVFISVLIPQEKVYGQVAQAAFDRANEQFQQANYTKAIRDYKTILKGGYESGPLYLNLGIAYTELDSLGMAKAWLMKAQNFMETELQATQALEFIESKFSKRAAILPELPWERFTQDQLQSIGLRGIIYWALFFLYLFAASIFAFWFAPISFQKAIKYTMYVMGALLLISSTHIGYAYHLKTSFNEAVTIVEEHEVYEKPKTDAVMVSKAYEGYTFRVDQRKADHSEWLFVRMSNGVEGWIQKKSVKVL